MDKALKDKLSTISFIAGIVFILVGLLGFINNPIFGIFEVDAVHNIVHLVTGAILVWAAYQDNKTTRNVSISLAVVYAIVTLLGFFSVGTSGSTELLGIMRIDSSDNFLHLFITIGLVALGTLTSKLETSRPNPRY